MDDYGAYLPSQDEIRKHCERFRTGWSRRETHRRQSTHQFPIVDRAINNGSLPHWTPPLTETHSTIDGRARCIVHTE